MSEHRCFNPRSRTGNDKKDLVHAALNDGFNPRSRTGNDYCIKIQGSTKRSFNPRSRTGNDTSICYSYHIVTCFNPRSRTGNDRKKRDDTGSRVQGFNPRSRTGNDVIFDSFHLQSGIVSIHVPARGTTILFCSPYISFTVSIHVPARGTTRVYSTGYRMVRGFNPRSRTGNDRIHARLCGSIQKFQSTFPHGERRKGNHERSAWSGFNPRSRTGNDSAILRL